MQVGLYHTIETIKGNYKCGCGEHLFYCGGGYTGANPDNIHYHRCIKCNTEVVEKNGQVVGRIFIKNTVLQDIIERLELSNFSMRYGAYNYDGMKLKDLKPGVIESTDVSESLLIDVRNNNIMIKELQEIIKGVDSEF